MIGDRRWCPTCRARVEVEEEYLTSRMTASGEVEYQAVGLGCGHGLAGPESPVAAAPGVPYAGARGYSSYRSFKRRWLHGGEVDV